MKASKTENRVEASFQQPKFGFKKQVLTSLLPPSVKKVFEELTDVC